MAKKAPVKFEVPEALRRRWASTDDAMQELKVSRDTIERWRADGKLTWRDYYGGHILISKDSIKAMLAPFI